MDQQTILILLSFLMNIFLIIERFLKRIKKSDCCGSHLEFTEEKNNIV